MRMLWTPLIRLCCLCWLAALACAADPAIGQDALADFFEAARRGDAEEIAELIAEGVSVDAIDNDGSTALHYASFGGHVSAVKALLKAGAKTGTLARHGGTPLHAAVAENRLKVAVALLESGSVDVDATTSCATADECDSGITPITVSKTSKAALRPNQAADWPRPDRSSAQPGATSGAERSLRRASWPRSEPPCFPHRPLMQAATLGHLQMVRALLEAGADALIAMPSGDAVDAAEHVGHAAVVKLLKKHLALKGLHAERQLRVQNRKLPPPPDLGSQEFAADRAAARAAHEKMQRDQAARQAGKREL